MINPRSVKTQTERTPTDTEGLSPKTGELFYGTVINSSTENLFGCSLPELYVYGGDGENRTHVPTVSDLRIYGWSNLCIPRKSDYGVVW